MSRWIDVTVPLDAGTVRWPGDRAFELVRESVVEDGGECNLSSFAMSAHLGTHMDAPLHYLASGESMDGLAFEAVIGPARVIEVAGGQVTGEELERHSIRAGERILLKTSNSDSVWHHEPFRRGYAHITESGAEHLAARHPAVMGVDYLSVGGPDESGGEVHRILSRAGIWIVESLNLHGVQPGEYEFVCLPLRIAGIEGAPARALLRQI
jgi:arylformamidase